jgi:hypothetical protein
MPAIRKLRSRRNKNKLSKSKRKSLKHNNKSRNKFKNESRSITKRSKLQKGGSEHMNRKSKNIEAREAARKRELLLRSQQHMQPMSAAMPAIKQSYSLPNQNSSVSSPVNINTISTIKNILMQKEQQEQQM